METIKNFITEYPDISSRVFREADKRANGFNDNDRVAYKIIKRLSKYFGEFEGAHKNRKRIMHVIEREISQARNEYSQRKHHRETLLFSSLTILDGGGSTIEFEPQDVLADVVETASYRESERGINQKIARLATSDQEMVILKAWLDGYYKTSEVACILANTFGGKADSHVRNINRFKNKCKKSIATVESILAS